MRSPSYAALILMASSPALLAAKGCHFGSDDVSLGADKDGSAGESSGGGNGGAGEEPGTSGSGGGAAQVGGTSSGAGMPGTGGGVGGGVPGAGGEAASAGSGSGGSPSGGAGGLLSYYACGLPIDDGAGDSCVLLPPVERFAFNSATLECEPFTAHCPEGNQNNFPTLEACRAACATALEFPDSPFTSEGDPSACFAPPRNGPCDELLPAYYFDPRTNTCVETVYSGCDGEPNLFANLEDCQGVCLPEGSSGLVLIPASSCKGFGTQVTDSSSMASFTLEGSILRRDESWGCGCASRAEWVMTYSLGSASEPAELRLCHDEAADTCEAHCSLLEWDLSEVLGHAGEFVFVD
ncbi:MAG TPA: BPTI/Kunitz-type proteinase inhibitor domain-containing protein [Polyangiaceae bacterium]